VLRLANATFPALGGVASTRLPTALEASLLYFTTLGIRVFTRFFAVLRLANATFPALGGVASMRLPTALGPVSGRSDKCLPTVLGHLGLVVLLLHVRLLVLILPGYLVEVNVITGRRKRPRLRPRDAAMYQRPKC
jgi:hypothetical protein